MGVCTTRVREDGEHGFDGVMEKFGSDLVYAPMFIKCLEILIASSILRCLEFFSGGYCVSARR